MRKSLERRLIPLWERIKTWLPCLALSLVLGGIVLDVTCGLLYGLPVSAVGTILAWFGRETRWHGIAIAAFSVGILVVLISLVVFVVGQGNFGVPARCGPY